MSETATAERAPTRTEGTHSHEHDAQEGAGVNFEAMNPAEQREFLNVRLEALITKRQELETALAALKTEEENLAAQLAEFEGAGAAAEETPAATPVIENDPEASDEYKPGGVRSFFRSKLGAAALAGLMGLGAGYMLFGGDKEGTNGDLDTTPDDLRDATDNGDLPPIAPDHLERIAMGGEADDDEVESNDEAAEDTETEEDEEVIEDGTWEIAQLEENDQKRWIEDGLESIRAAEPGTEMETFEEWLTAIKVDPDVFAKVTNEIVNPDTDFVAADFIGEDGRVNELAVESLAEIRLAVAQADLAFGYANADGWNTGYSDGEVTLAQHAGVHGDTRALTLTLEDGSRVDILGRCAQIVIDQPVHEIPKGPVDEDPEPKPEPEPKEA
jgi:hypothetical protein